MPVPFARFRRRSLLALPAVLVAGASVFLHQAAASGVQPSAGQSVESFTECVRAHGVPDFPGATVAEDGTVQFAGGGFDPLSSGYRAAAAKCAGRLPERVSLPREPALPSPEVPVPPVGCSSACPSPPAVPGPRF